MTHSWLVRDSGRMTVITKAINDARTGTARSLAWVQLIIYNLQALLPSLYTQVLHKSMSTME